MAQVNANATYKATVTWWSRKSPGVIRFEIDVLQDVHLRSRRLTKS